MIRGYCVYPFVTYLMAKQGIDSLVLAKKAGIAYATLRRVMRGGTSLSFDDALAIKKALKSDADLEKIFEKGDIADETK